MKYQYIYPGTFSPPTYGHLEVVRKVCQVSDNLTIICSTNPAKSEPWFSPEQAAQLWQTYNLPDKVTVTTLEQFRKNRTSAELVMVRGLRDASDFAYEQSVMKLNSQQFRINQDHYILADPEWADISSSAVRQAALTLDLPTLRRMVSPLTSSVLLEKALDLKGIYLVVGRPASGKSTLLKKMVELFPDIVHINTDEFNRELKPLVQEAFPGEDLVDMAINREKELLAVIAQPWLELLQKRLQSVPSGARVFVEAAYGMQESKALYRLLGGRVVYVGCTKRQSLARNGLRQTGQYAPFVESIPGWRETKRISQAERLELTRVDTSSTTPNTSCLAHDLERRTRK